MLKTNIPIHKYILLRPNKNYKLLVFILLVSYIYACLYTFTPIYALRMLIYSYPHTLEPVHIILRQYYYVSLNTSTPIYLYVYVISTAILLYKFTHFYI